MSTTTPDVLSDEKILHLRDIHVGEPTAGHPLDASDWIIFARAVLLAATPPVDAVPGEPEVYGLPFSEARRIILDMDAESARGMAISLLIQLNIANKYAAPVSSRAGSEPAATCERCDSTDVAISHGLLTCRICGTSREFADKWQRVIDEASFLANGRGLGDLLRAVRDYAATPTPAAPTKVAEPAIDLHQEAGNVVEVIERAGELGRIYCDLVQGHTPFLGDKLYSHPIVPAVAIAEPLTEAQIEKLREQTFSTQNPFCPVDSKSMRKAARAIESAHGIAPKGSPAGSEGKV